MIESIHLANIASYSTSIKVDNLKEINFFYGANGAGKTSIGRLIADPSISAASQVTWQKAQPLETLIYNNDFIERNYNSVPNLKGVFTLGETQQAQLDKITALKEEIDFLREGRDKYHENISGPDGKGGKEGELAALESDFKDMCWAQKRKHDEVFTGAFTGLRNNADHFKSRVLSERQSNTSDLIDIASLTEKAKLVYGPVPALLDEIIPLDVTTLIKLEADPILVTKVVGKNDVDIAAMIIKLNNSDWVQQGIGYFKDNDANCPFCQQKTSENFEKSLTEYFDETFEANTAAIKSLRHLYHIGALSMHQQIQRLSETYSEFIDKEKLNALLSLLSSLVTLNLQRIDNKALEPSSEVILESIVDVARDISLLISDNNLKVSEQNTIVANFKAEQTKLTGQVWRYILEAELKDVIGDYEKRKTAGLKALVGLRGKADSITTTIAVKENELKELEKTTTSIQPTVNAINHLLKSFGFKGFTLALTNSGDAYKLIRSDGTDAKTTLSEGEKTFVTFLYFYHLLKGSPTSTGMTADRVVVIDDPVSSLDSDVLFIVASLIKKIFAEIRNSKGYIKQVFILTHNVYFHKEITFNHQRKSKGNALDDETFWIVRKPAHSSKIENYPHNPIKTSYELLWAELRRPDPQSLTIQNTLRRILENYFKILGGIDLQHLWEHFEGEEATHCKSLISWVNDGSHFAHDDLYVVIDEPMVSSYLKVFFKIFKQTQHMPHYQMMMGDQYVDLDPEEPEADPQSLASLSSDSSKQPATALGDTEETSSEQVASPGESILSAQAPLIATSGMVIPPPSETESPPL